MVKCALLCALHSACSPEHIHNTHSHCDVGVGPCVALGQEVAAGSSRWHVLLENLLQHAQKELPELLYILNMDRGGGREEDGSRGREEDGGRGIEGWRGREEDGGRGMEGWRGREEDGG